MGRVKRGHAEEQEKERERQEQEQENEKVKVRVRVKVKEKDNVKEKETGLGRVTGQWPSSLPSWWHVSTRKIDFGITPSSSAAAPTRVSAAVI